MTAITLILTDAGLAALTNPAHTGTAALTISHIGLSQQHAGDAAVQQALPALPGEFKRLATFGGEVLSPRTIHVFLRDETADAYSLRAFGLYASTGVLLAVVSSEIPIMEKVPATTLLQAVDLAFARDIDAELVFGDTNFVNPPATTTRLGVVELATGAETVAGERHDLAVTPWGLAQTLLSWAQNFAAKAHRHLIGDIDGLSDALAAKANRSHTHGADDVDFGVFHVDRIPKLAIGWINGLTEQLAGLAAKNHSHAASDIDSGQLHLDRLPPIPQNKVTSLVATLADKASALHSHTMAQVSGLIDALAQKANLAGPSFSGTATFINALVNGVLSIAGPAPGNRRIFFRTDAANRWAINVNGVAESGGNSGSHFTVERFDDSGAYVDTAFHINRTTGQVTMPQRPGWAGAIPWDSVNFNPNTKATLGVNVNFRDVNASRNATDGVCFFGSDGSRWLAYLNGRYELIGLGGLTVNGHRAWTAEHFDAANLVTISATGLGKTGAGRLMSFSTPEAYGALPTGATAMVPPSQPGMPTTGYAYLSKIARRDAANGYAAIVVTAPTQAGDKPEAWIGGSPSDQSYAGWVKLWTDQNFNPADRAPALHSHDWAQVTGKPHLATTDGTGVSFGSWNFGVAVRVNGSDWRYLPNDARVEDIINWRAANNAETQAGALSNKFVSPAALWSFARSIGLNGYQQIPGTDLIIQWGVSGGNHAEGAVHASLPIAFGGGCLFACATPRNADQSSSMDFYMQLVGRYLDRIVFFANRANNSAGNMAGYEWMAVGLARGNPDPVYSTGGGFPPGGGGGGPEIIP